MTYNTYLKKHTFFIFFLFLIFVPSASGETRSLNDFTLVNPAQYYQFENIGFGISQYEIEREKRSGITIRSAPDLPIFIDKPEESEKIIHAVAPVSKNGRIGLKVSEYVEDFRYHDIKLRTISPTVSYIFPDFALGLTANVYEFSSEDNLISRFSPPARRFQNYVLGVVFPTQDFEFGFAYESKISEQNYDVGSKATLTIRGDFDDNISIGTIYILDSLNSSEPSNRESTFGIFANMLLGPYISTLVDYRKSYLESNNKPSSSMATFQFDFLIGTSVSFGGLISQMKIESTNERVSRYGLQGMAWL